MRNAIIVLLVSFMATSALAHDSIRLKALEKRIEELEERVDELESSTAPAVERVNAEQRANAQRRKAREHMRKDSSVYTGEQLREIESLYQVANKQWRSEEGKNSLKALIEQYDKANRTGCALLYLGQMSTGRERKETGRNKKKAEELFAEIISKYPDAINHKGRFLADLIDN